MEVKEVLEAKDLEKDASIEGMVVTKEKEMEMVTGTEVGKGPVNVEGVDDLSYMFLFT